MDAERFIKDVGFANTLTDARRAGPSLYIVVCGRRDVCLPQRPRFQLAGLALICLKNETKADAERDLRNLISAAGAEMAEKARRERLLRHLESADKAHPLELAKYCLERASASASELDIKQ